MRFGWDEASSWSREGNAAVEFYTQRETVYLDGLAGTGPFDLIWRRPAIRAAGTAPGA